MYVPCQQLNHLPTMRFNVNVGPLLSYCVYGFHKFKLHVGSGNSNCLPRIKNTIAAYSALCISAWWLFIISASVLIAQFFSDWSVS